MSDWTSIHGETPIDPSGLRPAIRRKVGNRAELNPLEAENIRLATVKYLATRPSDGLADFTVEWVLKLHKEMLGNVWLWAGQIRSVELNMGSRIWQIKTDLHNLLQDLRCWEDSDMPLTEQAARLHHRAVHIHPFENGNGRWARLLANIWLRLHGESVTIWPEQGVSDGVSRIRGEYINALRAADECDMSLLIELHNVYAARQD
ncbi:MAG: mobile mystery protein B [Phycisphaerae bacterium]|jgi:Fic-DOC domain mobile mystery protein B|nr:mobile mystery protein B [Phycisphaerae bacterium]